MNAIHATGPLPVSIRAPAWGATHPGGDIPLVHVFQSAPPRGGRREVRVRQVAERRFQSAPPRGGRPPNGERFRAPPVVSIRAPAWGATLTPSLAYQEMEFQSAPPRGGRPCLAEWGYPMTVVSIRAPAWGATALPDLPWVRSPVSIRAPAWGATGRQDGPGGQVHVSIRAPAWGATGPGPFGSDRRVVSIRAPAWGATPVQWRWARRLRVSIRAPAWGATGDHHHREDRRRVSIRAPAWGATAHSFGFMLPPLSFNPRPRVGGDEYGLPRTSLTAQFQSAPPRGGRRVRAPPHVPDRPVSIRAPAWGATPTLAPNSHLRSVSIRAPAWGATRKLLSALLVTRRFNPRPRVGGDLPSRWRLCDEVCFNPRPRVGGDDRRVARWVYMHKFQSAPPRGGRPA